MLSPLAVHACTHTTGQIEAECSSIATHSFCSYDIAIVYICFGTYGKARQKRQLTYRCVASPTCSYAIAIGYVCFDTYDKWGKTEEDARRKLTSRPIPDSVDLER